MVMLQVTKLNYQIKLLENNWGSFTLGLRDVALIMGNFIDALDYFSYRFIGDCLFIDSKIKGDIEILLGTRELN